MWKDRIQNCVDDIYVVVQRYSSLPILLGLMNSIVPCVLLGDKSILLSFFCSLPLILVFIPSLRSPGLAKYPLYHQFVKIIVCTCVGWCAIYVNRNLPDDHYTKQIYAKNCGAIIESEIIDTSCVGQSQPWLSNPRLIYARILKIKFTNSDRWKPCSGNIMIRLRDSPLVEYGSVVQLEGVFTSASPAMFSGDGFNHYLRARGVYRIFESSSIVFTNTINSSVSFACSFRNAIMDRVMQGLSLNTKKIVAAMFFGCKQGLDRITKDNFSMSGTSHAFAISGLHIGILSLLSLCVLRLFPLRMRFLVLPIVLGLYVVTVGMRVSAVRALIMISVWALHRALLYKTVSVNIVFFTGSIILISSPYSIVDVGFQYSFMTVFFLIVAWNYIRQWQQILTEHTLWAPAGNPSWTRPFLNRCQRAVFESISFCTVAWLSSSALTIFYNGFYILTSVLVNVFLIPLLMVLFFAVFIKFILPGFLAGIGIAGVEFTVTCLLELCQFGADNGIVIYISAVSLILILVYFLCLLSQVTTFSLYKSVVASIAIVSIILFIHCSVFESDLEIVVLKGREQPVVIILNNVTRSASIINCGSRDIARNITDLLRTKRIGHVDTLVLAGRTADFYRGVDYVSYKADVQNIYILPAVSRSRIPSYIIDRCIANGSEVVSLKTGDKLFHSRNGIITLRSQKNKYTVVLEGIEVRVSRDSEGCVRVTVNRDDDNWSESYVRELYTSNSQI